MSRALVLLTAAATLVTPLAAQADVTRLSGRVATDVAVAVSAMADSARALGLPTRPLVDKALEGTTKGVAPERIVVAVHDVLGRLQRSAAAIRDGTGGAATDQEIEAGAFALSAGLSAGDVGDLASAAGSDQTGVVALQVAGALAALGVPPTQTVSLVRTELQSGVPVGELTSLTGQVQAAMAGGLPPADAAAGLQRAAAAHATPHGKGKGRDNPHRP